MILIVTDHKRHWMFQEAQKKAVVAKNLAADYLARHFDSMFNAFDVCLVTYALHEANHVSKGEFFRKMRKIKISGWCAC